MRNRNEVGNLVMPVRVALLGSRKLLGETLTERLKKQPGIQFQGCFEELEALQRAAGRLGIDVILADALCCQDRVEMIRNLRARWPQAAVIILGVQDRADAVLGLIEAGASGYLLKTACFAEVLAVIRSIHAGQTRTTPRMLSAIFNRIHELSRDRLDRPDARLESLSTREREVLRLLASGRLNKEIAQQLRIAVHTVKNHVHHILQKLQVDGRRRAACYARAALLEPGNGGLPTPARPAAATTTLSPNGEADGHRRGPHPDQGHYRQGHQDRPADDSGHGVLSGGPGPGFAVGPRNTR